VLHLIIADNRGVLTFQWAMCLLRGRARRQDRVLQT